MAVRGAIQGDFLRKRIQVAFWLILACYLGLIGRLLYLQGVQGPALYAEAVNNREKKIVLPAHRGAICDRDGRPLAVSRYSGTVGFDPAAAQPDPDKPRDARKQQELLTSSIQNAAGILGMNLADLNATVRKACADFNPNKPVRFVPIKKDVPLDVVQKLKDFRPRLLGFGVLDSSKRLYPAGDNATQVVGYLTSKGGGASGLERAGETWLAGTDGYTLSELDERFREIPETLRRMVPARDGQTICTTLDSYAQHIATEEARILYQKYHPKGVSVVIVEPETGDLLALVSMPTFDPNPGKRSGFTRDALFERCAAHLYEPGSTLKALTIAAALDDGLIDEYSSFFCSGELHLGKKTIHCDSHGGNRAHGDCTPVRILEKSCNVSTARIGLKMGARRLYEWEHRFGLLDDLSIPLPSIVHGNIAEETRYNPSDAARVAFGQSINTSPVHVAIAYAAIANGGKLMQPRLVTALKDSRGHVQKQWDTKVVRRVLSEETCRKIGPMLRQVVTSGTGKVTAIPGYQIAGKTGTASKHRDNAYVGSFIGYLPASSRATPRAVILVAVDEPQGAYYGADVAAPAFRNIASRLVDYWNTPQDDPDQTQYLAAQMKLHPGQRITLKK